MDKGASDYVSNFTWLVPVWIDFLQNVLWLEIAIPCTILILLILPKDADRNCNYSPNSSFINVKMNNSKNSLSLVLQINSNNILISIPNT